MKYTFYCQVMEIFNDTALGIEKKIFYNVVEVQKPIIAKKYYVFGILVLMAAVILLFCVLLFQKRKLKKAKEKLEYEKHDVRNIAHIELKNLTEMTQNDIDELHVV
jgi:flagellar biosynthesis/type III secretory pathway M-ring protein FliF/YscJ